MEQVRAFMASILKRIWDRVFHAPCPWRGTVDSCETHKLWHGSCICGKKGSPLAWLAGPGVGIANTLKNKAASAKGQAEQQAREAAAEQQSKVGLETQGLQTGTAAEAARLQDQANQEAARIQAASQTAAGQYRGAGELAAGQYRQAGMPTPEEQAGAVRRYGVAESPGGPEQLYSELGPNADAYRAQVASYMANPEKDYQSSVGDVMSQMGRYSGAQAVDRGVFSSGLHAQDYAQRALQTLVPYRMQAITNALNRGQDLSQLENQMRAQAVSEYEPIRGRQFQGNEMGANAQFQGNQMGAGAEYGGSQQAAQIRLGAGQTGEAQRLSAMQLGEEQRLQALGYSTDVARQIAQQNVQLEIQSQQGIGKVVGGSAGAIAGSFAGPQGAALGYQIGSGIGGGGNQGGGYGGGGGGYPWGGWGNNPASYGGGNAYNTPIPSANYYQPMGGFQAQWNTGSPAYQDFARQQAAQNVGGLI